MRCMMLSLVLLAGCANPPLQPDPSRLAAAVNGLLESAVKNNEVPGAVAAVADSERIIYEGAESFPDDAIFAIASMTKPITSVAVMQLVEIGKVDLNKPASAYVPDLAKVEVLENGKLRPPKSPVTVHQLLTHTAGFGYEFMDPELLALVKEGKLPSLMTSGDGFLGAPLLFDPGEKWQYGINLDWLGVLVEQVSGQDLEAYLRDHVFQPLGMDDTFFRVPDDKKNRLVNLFQRKDNDSLVEQAEPVQLGGTFLSGGGGVYSTAADYLRFARALLGGGELEGKRILKPETVAQMGRNQIGDLAIQPFRSLIPQLAKDQGELPGALDKFGYGFALNSRAIENGRGANTMSWAGIFNTFFWVDREKKICAVLMTQMSPGLDDGPANLIDDFNSEVYAWLNGGI